jgi:hypothetical protein
VATSGITWKDAALAILAVVAPVVSGSLYMAFDNLDQRFEERCRVMSENLTDIRDRKRAIEVKADTALLSLRELSTRFSDHIDGANRWIDVIQATEKRVTDLQTRSNARPDPYTGSDARSRAAVVDKALQNLEWRVDALEGGGAGRKNGNGVKR